MLQDADVLLALFADADIAEVKSTDKIINCELMGISLLARLRLVLPFSEKDFLF